VRAHGLEAELADADFLDDGRTLRRHGYLFRCLPWDGPLPAARSAPGAVLAAGSARSLVVAWPWSAGATGEAAVLASGELVLLHPNADRAASGPDAPPAGLATGAELSAGWVVLPGP
jgi:hypothetical protein